MLPTTTPAWKSLRSNTTSLLKSEEFGVAQHLINLSVRDLLYGSKRENIAAIVAADGDDQDEDEHIDHAIDEALDGEARLRGRGDEAGCCCGPR